MIITEQAAYVHGIIERPEQRYNVQEMRLDEAMRQYFCTHGAAETYIKLACMMDDIKRYHEEFNQGGGKQ